MFLLHQRNLLKEAVNADDRIQCVLRRGACEELLEHTDALPEDIVHA